jgi:hypothetical protein
MNLLLNAEFEDTLFVPAVVSDDGFREFRVPRDWSGGVLRRPAPQRWINRIPNGAAGSRRVSGARSFLMYCEDGTFTAWLFQRFTTSPRTPLTAGAQAFIEGMPGSVARVGIDPNGGENPYARGVIWSPWATVLNRWVPRSVACSAEGEYATIFLYATQSMFTDPNGVYWDSAYADGTAGSGDGVTRLDIVLDFNIRFRSGPGVEFDELARIPRGTELVAVGRSYDGLWIATDYQGQFGWLTAQYGRLSGDVMRLPVLPVG